MDELDIPDFLNRELNPLPPSPTMTETVVKPNRLECSKCGVVTDAACDCGVGYVPAGTRAAQAVAANPEKSDRAIADEFGVNRRTVIKARKQVVHRAPPEKRTGKDGKSYPARRLGHVQQAVKKTTEKIAAAIAANPKKSNHSIAADLGVMSETVGNVRQSIDCYLPVGTPAAVAASSPAPKTLDDWCGETIAQMTEAYATVPANERGEFIARMRRAIDELEKDRPE